jgi:hypothetical protein
MQLAALALIAGSVVPFAFADDGAKLTAMEKGASKEIGFYAARRRSRRQAGDAQKPPEGVPSARYGVLPVAGPEGAVFTWCWSRRMARRGYVSNGNGDPTDDPRRSGRGAGQRPHGKEYTPRRLRGRRCQRRPTVRRRARMYR